MTDRRAYNRERARQRRAEQRAAHDVLSAPVDNPTLIDAIRDAVATEFRVARDEFATELAARLRAEMSEIGDFSGGLTPPGPLEGPRGGVVESPGARRERDATDVATRDATDDEMWTTRDGDDGFDPESAKANARAIRADMPPRQY